MSSPPQYTAAASPERWSQSPAVDSEARLDDIVYTTAHLRHLSCMHLGLRLQALQPLTPMIASAVRRVAPEAQHRALVGNQRQVAGRPDGRGQLEHHEAGGAAGGRVVREVVVGVAAGGWRRASAVHMLSKNLLKAQRTSDMQMLSGRHT